MKNMNIYRERRGWFRVNIKNFFFQIQPLKKLIPHGSQISILIFHLSLSPYLLQEYLFMANFSHRVYLSFRVGWRVGLNCSKSAARGCAKTTCPNFFIEDKYDERDASELMLL